MKYKSIMVGLIGVFILIHNAEAASKQFKVQFVVPVENELTDQVKSYVTRELRSLHDVELIGKDPNLDAYFISIYPVPLTSANGITTGVVLSYVIEKDGVIEHAVLIDSPNQLKTICEKITSHFDTKWLGQRRRK